MSGSCGGRAWSWVAGGISRFLLWLNRLGHGRINASLHLAVTSRVQHLSRTSSFKSETGVSDRDGVSCADPWICRQPRLLEHIGGQPALCMTNDRSLGRVWHKVLGQVQVQVLLGDSLLSDDATWALSDCASISGMGPGMGHPEIGSLGAKGWRQDL